jgi:LacI family transcriptional regulator
LREKVNTIKKNVKNIRELAELTGFSVSTVSRVLNGKGELYRISHGSSEEILKAAAEHNYYPNRIARGLRLEKTETLGLIIPDIANPFFSSIAKTIEIESRKYGYSIFLCDSLDDTSTERELLNLLAGRRVDGIILAPVGLTSDHVNEFSRKGIPIVIIDRYFPDTVVPYITTDSYYGACQATGHIIANGHRTIACIQGMTGISANSDRVRGYKDTLEKNGIPVDSSLIVGDNFGEENGYIQAHLLMRRKNRPTAIFALSNLISLGAMRAIAENNLKIPDDISLVSFDDQPYSALLASPMTTVEQEKDEIAMMAVKLLMERVAGKNESYEIKNIMIKPKLIIRKSVRNIKS